MKSSSRMTCNRSCSGEDCACYNSIDDLSSLESFFGSDRNDCGAVELSNVSRLTRGCLKNLVSGSNASKFPIFQIVGLHRVDLVLDSSHSESRLQLVLFDGHSRCNYFYFCKHVEPSERRIAELMYSIVSLSQFDQASTGFLSVYITVISEYEILVPGRLLRGRKEDSYAYHTLVNDQSSDAMSTNAIWNAIESCEMRLRARDSVSADGESFSDNDTDSKGKTLLGYTNNLRFRTFADDVEHMRLTMETYDCYIGGGLRRTTTIAKLREKSETVGNHADRKQVVLRVRLTSLTEPQNAQGRQQNQSHAKSRYQSKRVCNLRFADETGEVKATVFEEELDAVYHNLAIGCVYMVIAPRVELLRKPEFTSCTCRFELIIARETRIVQVATTDPFLYYLLPVATFNFTPFDALAGLNLSQQVDLVGCITRFSIEETGTIALSTQTPDNFRVKLMVVDETGFEVMVILFDQLAVTFKSLLRRASDSSSELIPLASISSDSGLSDGFSNASARNFEKKIVAFRDLRVWKAMVCDKCGAAVCSVKTTPSSTAFFRSDIIGPRFSELRDFLTTSSSGFAVRKRKLDAFSASQAGAQSCENEAVVDSELFEKHVCDLLDSRSSTSTFESPVNVNPPSYSDAPATPPVAKRVRPCLENEATTTTSAISAPQQQLNCTFSYHYSLEQLPEDSTSSPSLLSRVLSWFSLPFRALRRNAARTKPISENNEAIVRQIRAAINRDRPDQQLGSDVTAVPVKCSNVADLLKQARVAFDGSSMQNSTDTDTVMLNYRLFEVSFRIDHFSVHRTADFSSDLVHLIVTDPVTNESEPRDKAVSASVLCDDIVAHAVFGAAYGLLTTNAKEYERLTTSQWPARRVFRCVVFPVYQHSTNSLAFVAYDALEKH